MHFDIGFLQCQKIVFVFRIQMCIKWENIKYTVLILYLLSFLSILSVKIMKGNKTNKITSVKEIQTSWGKQCQGQLKLKIVLLDRVCPPLRTSSFIGVISLWGFVSLRLSPFKVVFLSGILHFRSFIIEVIIHWGRLPFSSSSIKFFFNWHRLPFR